MLSLKTREEPALVLLLFLVEMNVKRHLFGKCPLLNSSAVKCVNEEMKTQRQFVRNIYKKKIISCIN